MKIIVLIMQKNKRKEREKRKYFYWNNKQNITIYFSLFYGNTYTLSFYSTHTAAHTHLSHFSYTSLSPSFYINIYTLQHTYLHSLFFLLRHTSHTQHLTSSLPLRTHLTTHTWLSTSQPHTTTHYFKPSHSLTEH